MKYSCQLKIIRLLVAVVGRHGSHRASRRPSQREALARDWWAGRTLLTEHREYLRQELRGLRKKSFTGRFFRAVWWAITDQPGRLLLLIALLAINVALWRFFCTPETPAQVFIPPTNQPDR